MAAILKRGMRVGLGTRVEVADLHFCRSRIELRVEPGGVRQGHVQPKMANDRALNPCILPLLFNIRYLI